MLRDAFKKNKPLFIPFMMAGSPNLETTTQAIIALSAAGADIIELGVPFSDPIADGPINQRAAETALKQGVNLDLIFNCVKYVRQQDCHTPIILFSYLNPLLAFGVENLIAKAKDAHITGVLIVDLPPEEGLDIYFALKQAGLEIILLASPTTTLSRLDLYQQLDPSFLYYISRLAVTGLQTNLCIDLKNKLEQLRAALPAIKIAVGFGISTPAQAAEVARVADGVIIGSLLVNTLAQQGLAAFRHLATELADGIHRD